MGGERSAAGRVWMDLLHKHMHALREGDEPRRARLMALADQIEAEYPQQIAQERALWGPVVTATEHPAGNAPGGA